MFRSARRSYVLKSKKNMKEVTALKGKGFSEDNFARYVGSKPLPSMGPRNVTFFR